MTISTWYSLEAEAVEVALMSAQQSKSICILLQGALSTLADGFTEVELQNTRSTHAQMGLFSQNLNSLKCSIDLATRGYYTQSIDLLRCVYENWIAFHYLTRFPKKADLWLCADKRPPRHSDMLKALGPEFIEDKAAAREWYGTLCHFAHTDSLVVLPHLGSYNGEACAFFGAKYKPDLFHTCAYTISLFTSIMLREVSQYIGPDVAWHQRYINTIEQLLHFIEQENDEFNRSKEMT